MNAWLPIIGPSLALVSSLVVAALVYRKGMRGNEIAAQAGIATRDAISIGQVVDGQNKLIAALQADNLLMRDDLRHMYALRRENRELKARNGALESANGV